MASRTRSNGSSPVGDCVGLLGAESLDGVDVGGAA
jgi:hypothetical protein